MTRRRFPGAVYRVGEEPDARFSLANERTFLAWNRTALALMAAGVALEVLGLELHAGLRLTASVLLVLAGIALPIVAWFEWMATERALRTGAELPGAITGFALAGVIVVVGVLVGLGILLR